MNTVPSPEDIDQMIAAAGLHGIMAVYDSTIVIDVRERTPDGERWDAYRALAQLIDHARRRLDPPATP